MISPGVMLLRKLFQSAGQTTSRSLHVTSAKSKIKIIKYLFILALHVQSNFIKDTS